MKPSANYLGALLVAMLLAACHQNPHSSKGLSYTVKSENASPTLKTVEFKFNQSANPETLEVRTTYPEVQFSDLNGDDVPDIIVTSETFKTYRVEIAVFVVAADRLDLKVIKNKGMGVNYPKQGLVSP
jgi:hypothetical protein